MATLTPNNFASDDLYRWAEDELIASGLLAGSVLSLNVLANDKNIKPRSLFSIDDGNGHTNLTDYDLLNADKNGVWEATSTGNRIRINNGQIELDIQHSLQALGAADVNALQAGEHIHEEFVYALQVANGALSQAKVVVDIYGQNDAASISGDSTATIAEHATNPVEGVLTVVDPDHGESHTQIATDMASDKGLGTYSVDANGHWSYTVNNALVQHLNANETETDTFTVYSLDGTASQLVTITIQGENDNTAPVLQDVVPAGQVFGNDSLTLSATIAFTDVDVSDSHIVTFAAQGNGYIGTFTPVIGTDSTGGGPGDIDLTFFLTKAEFDAAFPSGQIPPDYKQDYLVTIDDGHGGTASELVSIPLAQILSDAGGGDGGGGPNNPPHITESSTDTTWAVVWDNPAVTTLYTNGFLSFVDPDPNDSHHVEVFPAAGNWGHLTWTLLDAPPNGGQGQIQWSYSLDESLVRPYDIGEGRGGDIFTFRVYDSTGAFDERSIVVNIIATDEAPVIQGPNSFVVDVSAGGAIDRAGTVIFTDADISDHHYIGYDGLPGPGDFFNATLIHDTVNGTGGEVNWTFQADPLNWQYLAEGETAYVSRRFTVYDDGLSGHGLPGPDLRANVDITFAVAGVNDLPEFSPGWYGGNGQYGTTFSDPDLNDTHTAYAVFNAGASSVGGETGHASVSIVQDSTGHAGPFGQLSLTYDPGTATAPTHQVYDVYIQDNHGGLAMKTFNFDLA